MQPRKFVAIAPKPSSPSLAPPTARAGPVVAPVAPPPPVPQPLRSIRSQNAPQAPPVRANPPPALRALEPIWVNETLLPFLHYACIDLGLSASQLKEHVIAAKTWASSHPAAPTGNEEVLFERVFMSVMNRHNTIDAEIAPYTEVTPLARYLVRRAMIKGSYKLLDRKWTGSAEWVKEMSVRYKCTCEACGGSKGEVVPTEEMMGREVLE